MENKVKNILINIKNPNIKLLFEVFLCSVYKYDIIFEINETLNELNKIYGNKEKLSPIVKGMTYQNEILLFKPFYRIYHRNNDEYLKNQKRIDKLKQSIKTAIAFNFTYAGYEDEINDIKKSSKKLSISKYIFYYMKDYRNLHKIKEKEEFDAELEDFALRYFGDIGACKKYCDKLYKLTKLIDLKQIDKKIKQIDKNIEKHMKFIHLFKQYNSLIEQLKEVNDKIEISYHDFVINKISEIDYIFTKRISNEAIDHIEELLNTNEESLLCMEFIPYTSFFNEFNDIKGSGYEFLFKGKNSTLSISDLKKKIEKKQDEFDFELANELLEISESISI